MGFLSLTTSTFLIGQLSLIAAQTSNNPNPVGYSIDAGDAFVCKGGLAATNVSDIVTFPVQWEDSTLNQTHKENKTVVYVPGPSWAMTISQNDTLKTTFWYDTAGQNYSSDLTIGYDSCAFIFDNLPENTIRLAQNDPGNCTTTLSNDCRKKLLGVVASSAQKWTSYSSPPPYQNLSAGVLPTICQYIRKDLLDSAGRWPQECAQDLGSGVSYDIPDSGPRTATAIQVPLTGYNSSIMDISSDCSFSDGNKTFHGVMTRVDRNETYDVATRNVYPVLSVYFSVANHDRVSYTSYADSEFVCLRAKTFTEGSRVSPSLPAGTAYSTTSKLSGGAIAGIVIGTLVGVALCGLGVWFFLRRHNRASKAKRLPEVIGNEDKSPEIDGTERHELSPVDKKIEIDNGQVTELGNAQGKPGELYGSGMERSELYGTEVQR